MEQQTDKHTNKHDSTLYQRLYLSHIGQMFQSSRRFVFYVC